MKTLPTIDCKALTGESDRSFIFSFIITTVDMLIRLFTLAP